MSNESIRAGYRERLTEGDIVYFVEGESFIGTGPLVVKKASVTSTSMPNNQARRYTMIAPWESIDKDPKNSGMRVARSPRELFTDTEVQRALNQYEGPLCIDGHPMDALITDPLANVELVGVLGSVVINRLADDELRRPHDPEY